MEIESWGIRRSGAADPPQRAAYAAALVVSRVTP